MSAEAPTPILEYTRLDYRGKIRLMLHVSGSTFTDKVDVFSERSRKQYLAKVQEKYPGLDPDHIERELERFAVEVAAESDAANADDGDSDVCLKDKELLVQIATNREQIELFHTPGRHDAEAYASIMIEGHKETWPLNAKGFEQRLVHQFYQLTGGVPGSQSIHDAMTLIRGIALFEGDEHQVHLRVAEHEGDYWLDLANDDWSAVRITSAGWEIVPGDRVPVRFRRRRGMRPLPSPVRNGSVDELRTFVNIPDDDDWYLYKAVLIAYYRPRGPYPPLVANGEQGSAKSTLLRFTRALVDPNKSPLRRPPKDVRELMIAANNAWFVCFDNLSGLSIELSDSLCVLATGGGFSARELFSDDEEKLFDAQRPVIINGIEDLATRSDLADRSIVLTLPAIPESLRRDEATLLQEFEQASPRILGALLQALSLAMRELPNVRIERLPRMADFAKFGVAAEAGLGIPSGAFLAAYADNRQGSRGVALESSPIGLPILSLMEGCARWEGSCTQLLDALEPHTDERTRQCREWPKRPRGLRSMLARLAPVLRSFEIEVIWPGRKCGGNRKRQLVLQRIEGGSSAPAAASASPSEGRSRDDGREDDRPSESTLWSDPMVLRDGRDDRDGPFQTCGNDGEDDSEAGDPSMCVDRTDKVGNRPSLPSLSSPNGPGEPPTQVFEGRSRDDRGGHDDGDRPDEHLSPTGAIIARDTTSNDRPLAPCYACKGTNFVKVEGGPMWICEVCHGSKDSSLIVERFTIRGGEESRG